MNIINEALRAAEEVALPIFESEIKYDNRCRVALKKFKETGEQDSSVAWASRENWRNRVASYAAGCIDIAIEAAGQNNKRLSVEMAKLAIERAELCSGERTDFQQHKDKTEKLFRTVGYAEM
jgi:hypothetical protein